MSVEEFSLKVHWIQLLSGMDNYCKPISHRKT